MSASTALQTSLKDIFSEEMHKHISLQCVNFDRRIILTEMYHFIIFNHFVETMKILLQSKPFSLKQLLMCFFWQTRFVECESHCSHFREQYIRSNQFYSGNNNNMAPQTNLPLPYHCSMPCRLHVVYQSEASDCGKRTHSIQYITGIHLFEFWRRNVQTTVILTFVVHRL